MANSELSKSDARILVQLFDPESSPSDGVLVDTSLPADMHYNEAVLEQLRARELEAIQYIESFSASNVLDVPAKEATFQYAFEQLSSLIKEYPQYASTRNNRAQLCRWRFGDESLVADPQIMVRDNKSYGMITLEDLNAAIKLASPVTGSAVSPSQGNLLAQAYTQRAALYLAAAKSLEARRDIDALLWPDATYEELAERSVLLVDVTAEELEDRSAKDFFQGGRYGNKISKAMAVQTNPYAKLCGNIVQEAMRKEFEAMREVGSR
jgi:hypothetical protein